LQFAIAYIKAKVEPNEMEKEVVSVLEETWVKATGLPRKAEVIKEISHLIGDPQDVDERGLKNEDVVRVRVLCKDTLKIEGSTLVHINGQGHMIK
jgi:hypothetical protein